MTTFHHDNRFGRLCLLAAGGLLVFLSLITARPAHASFPATTTPGVCTTEPCYEYSFSGYANGPFVQSSWMTTPQAALNDFATKASAAQSQLDWTGCFVVGSAPSSYEGKCTIRWKGGDVLYTDASVGTAANRSVAPTTPVYSCPSGATLSGSVCTCTAPSVENSAHNGCQAPTCVAGPAGFHRGVVPGEKVNPFSTCYQNCLTTAVPRLDLGVSVTTGSPVQTYATWELVRKAEECDSSTSSLPSLPTSGTTPTQPTPEAECPAGQRRVYFASGVPTCAPIPEDRFCPVGYTYGTINGKDTCISQSNGPPTSSSPATTDKTPATESKESSTTTTNPDGSTTTTKTTSNGKGGGSVTTTTTSADGKTIESVTKRMGDDPDGKCEPGTLGCMKTGTPSGSGPSKSDRTVTLGGTGLSGFTSECPADRSIDTQFGTLHVSFSSMCAVAPYLKPLILLAAALIAMSIVVSSLRS